MLWHSSGYVAKIDNAGDGEAVDRLRIANGMSADDRAANFGGFLDAAAQNFGDRFWGNEILRKAHDV